MPDEDVENGTENMGSYTEIIANDPQEMLRILADWDNSRLTFAAEEAGKLMPAEQCVGPLIRILKEHPRPVAREGALIGLSYHDGYPAVIEAVKWSAENDPSPTIRELAQAWHD